MSRYWSGAYWSRAIDSLDELTLYPLILYKGCKVLPYGWHPTSTEPMLQVFAEDLDWTKYFGKPPSSVQAFLDGVRQDGWEWDRREGGLKYVHVDELEKIKGPPPEGAF